MTTGVFLRFNMRFSAFIPVHFDDKPVALQFPLSFDLEFVRNFLSALTGAWTLLKHI